MGDPLAAEEDDEEEGGEMECQQEGGPGGEWGPPERPRNGGPSLEVGVYGGGVGDAEP